MIYIDNEHVFLDKKSGDRERIQNSLDYETDLAQNHLNNLRSDMIVPTTQSMFNNYSLGADKAFGSYDEIMDRYRGEMDRPGITADQVTYQRTPELSAALSGYGDFATTGGFDDAARRDIRARGISPIRTAYGNTIMNLNRARALGGEGGASNYIAATSKAQRELPQQLADATQNVNAQLAHMIQQGRLAGLGGLSSTAQADIGFDQRAKLANQAANLQASTSNLASRNAALSGMSSLYSATPGLASTFGNQVLGSTGNWLNAERLQGDKGRLKLMGQLQHAETPTGFQAALGNLGRMSQIAANLASIPFGGGAGAIGGNDFGSDNWMHH